MYEKMISGFVKDVIASGKKEYYTNKDLLISLYTAAKDSDIECKVKVIDSGAINGIPYIEVFERYTLDDEYKNFIEFDVVYSGVDGITAISAVVGDKFADELVVILTRD